MASAAAVGTMPPLERTNNWSLHKARRRASAWLTLDCVRCSSRLALVMIAVPGNGQQHADQIEVEVVKIHGLGVWFMNLNHYKYEKYQFDSLLRTAYHARH